MDPEQGLLVIHKHLAVKRLVILCGALVGVLVPERAHIV